jgi:hypothetical protein
MIGLPRAAIVSGRWSSLIKRRILGRSAAEAMALPRQASSRKKRDIVEIIVFLVARKEAKLFTGTPVADTRL